MTDFDHVTLTLWPPDNWNQQNGISLFFFPVEKEKEVDKFIQNCDTSRLMQDLIGSYIMMEEYFMREMVLKVSSAVS